MSDFNSASENADLFQAAFIRFGKLADYSNAVSARFSECLEAVQSLPKSERTSAIVKELVSVYDKRMVCLTKEILSLGELISTAKTAPDYVTKGFDIALCEQVRAEAIASAKEILPGLKNLQNLAAKLP